MFCRRFAILICMLTMMSSCSKPVKDSVFCNLDIKTGWVAPVSLNLEMIDTLNSTRLDICMQLKTQNLEDCTSIPLILNIISPDSLQYTDTLQLPLQIVKEKDVYNNSNGHITMQWPYRKNVITKVPGEWSFTFTPTASANEINRKIIGLGISCKKER